MRYLSIHKKIYKCILTFLSIALTTVLTLVSVNANQIEQDNPDISVFLPDITINNDIVIGDGTRVHRNIMTGDYYLRLVDFATHFGIKIEKKPDDKITGWAISPRNKFYFDKKVISLGEKSIVLSPDQYIVVDEAVAISYKVLSEIFSVDFVFDYNAQKLDMKTQQKYPALMSYARDQQRKNFGFTPPAERKATFPLISDDKDITTPLADLSLSFGNAGANFSMYLKNKILDVDNRISYQNSSSGNPSLLFTLKKRSQNSDLLGVLKASEIELGDISLPATDLVTGSESGVGFVVSNDDLINTVSFNQIELEGDILKDWEVEVYRNGMLLGFHKANENGRYSFKDVPLLKGANKIKMLFYNPFGGVTEKVKDYLLTNDLSSGKKLKYSFAVVRKRKRFFDIGDTKSTARNHGAIFFSNKYEYGLSRYLSVSSSINSLVLGSGIRHNYLGAGLTSTFLNTRSRLLYSTDLNPGNGSAISFEVSKSIKKINLSFKHTKI